MSIERFQSIQFESELKRHLLVATKNLTTHRTELLENTRAINNQSSGKRSAVNQVNLLQNCMSKINTIPIIISIFI